MTLPGLTLLKTRADYLVAQRGKPVRRPAFTLRAHRRGSTGDIRVGFTCSKKVGNAVARNRAKRRLREVARQVLPEHGRDGYDYVLIGRRDVTATRKFSGMQNDLERALLKVHGS